MDEGHERGNAVKTRIWIAVSVCVLVAIVRKRLGLDASLCRILRILGVTRFQKTPIWPALPASDFANQLILFGLRPKRDVAKGMVRISHWAAAGPVLVYPGAMRNMPEGQNVDR